eukprot:gene5277-10560_t
MQAQKAYQRRDTKAEWTAKLENQTNLLLDVIMSFVWGWNDLRAFSQSFFVENTSKLNI